MLKFKGVLLGTEIVFSSSISTHLGTSVKAVQTIDFDISEATEVNLPSFSFTQSGVTISLVNPVGSPATGSTGVFDTLNSRSDGFCAFAVVGTSASRCQYSSTGNTPVGPFAPGSVFNGFTFSFDKPGILNSFSIPWLQAVSGPTIEFTAGTQTQTFTGFSQNQTLSFSSPFSLAANESVFVITGGSVTGSNGSGAFRIDNINFTDVPGPAGYLGLAAAFKFSRRLKSKLHK